MKFRLWARVGMFVVVLMVMSTKVTLAQSGAFCTTGANPTVNTALGCVPVQMGPFVAWLLPYLFGVAGGISFLLMVYGFILMMMSAGDPKAVQGAQETITSAIVGLLVSIFAVFLLRLVALQILVLPGL